MPVESGTTLNLSRSIVFAAISLVLGLGLVFLITQLAGSGSIDVKLGDETFDAGPAANRAEEVADGGPLFLPSLSRNRPIVLNHLGAEPTQGWVALDPRAPADPANCVLAWDATSELFFDQCDPANTYPADGTGLLGYSVSVNGDGDLIVDLAGNDAGP